jgi:hypothetical protein
MGCRRVPAGCVLFVPVLFMWNVVVLLLMHLLGASDCVVASYVFVKGPISLYLTVQQEKVTNHLSESGFKGIIGKLSSSTSQKKAWMCISISETETVQETC